ncbi:MAG: DUF2786 domain-containing protein [Desulfosporosinus sp.]|nr:DUF2786 domain-containing protein [Desulfosporosinus sp.]
MSSNEKILEKLRKILAKANNNPSAEEAETAMLIAQRIMVENNLCIDDVNLTEGDKIKKEAVEVTVSDKMRLAWWESDITSIIAKNFRCKSFTRRFANQKNIRLCLMGLKEDVEIAKETISYALKAMSYYSSQFVKANKGSEFTTTQIRNSWLNGFIRGLGAKFDKQVKQNNWGLVLVKDKVVEDAIEKLGLKKRRSTSITGGISSAYQSGYRQGQSFESRSGVIR